MKDYYKILETDKSASQEEIKQKYRQLAKKWHPDANGNNREAEEKFKDIAEAYSILSSPIKKREYDASVLRESYARNSKSSYQDCSWQTEDAPFETPFYTFYYTSKKNKNKGSGSILKGLFQIALGVILFPLPGFFPFLGIYAVFSGVVNIKRAINF